FFNCAQIQSREIRLDELVSYSRYFFKLEEVLSAMKSDEHVVALVKSLTNEVKENEGSAFKAVLLLKCREMHSDVWGAIDEQFLLRD
ncbi:hypothetical protein pdam_00021821, partial [Pocillopora damicornis]